MFCFCSKCGSLRATNAQSCPTCGAPVGKSAEESALAQPVGTPATSGTNAVKVVLIIVAALVGLGILGAGVVRFFAWRAAHAVHVSSSGSHMTLSKPDGSISINTNETYTASDLGTDIYPGVTVGKGVMRMTLPTGAMVSATCITTDTKDQVLAFYREKFGNDVSVPETADGAVITTNKSPRKSVVITITKQASEYGGKTQIHTVHTMPTKSA